MAPNSSSSRSRPHKVRFTFNVDGRPRKSESQRTTAPVAPRSEERASGRRGGNHATCSGGHRAHSCGNSRRTPTPSATPERPIGGGRPPRLVCLDPEAFFTTQSAAWYEPTVLLEISDMISSTGRSRVYQELYTPVVPMSPLPQCQYPCPEVTIFFYLPGGRYFLPVYSLSDGLEMCGYVYQRSHTPPRARMYPAGGQTGSQDYRYHWQPIPCSPRDGVPDGAPGHMEDAHYQAAQEEYYAHHNVQQLILTPATVLNGIKYFYFA
ncbi:uncharacterized protein LOC124160614 [Ischnura elegans]|uniref:uncharacterized protein LOC124160614 n=1 Tax=Ischnura elegans TaxID=197161 RepID=UPI001ED8B350|nr:uncharacterized protein LOC124160614 [Ischnura elegans]